MSLKFEQTIFELLGNVSRNVKPLNLGGYAASGGGGGGPPGGFIGYLPQTRVTYDTTEEASLFTPISGSSLVDNLNHIRYRISAVEALGNPGIDIYDDGVLVNDAVHTVDFINHFNVEVDGVDGVTVSLLSSGVLSDVTYSGVYGESLTSYINGIEDHFDVLGTINDSSLAVYLNGVRQSTSEYTLDGDCQGFTTTFIPIAGDTLEVDYIEAYTGAFHTHSQYAVASGVLTLAQVYPLIAAKADLTHTHIESDITDLDHDATKIRGTPVASGVPLPDQVLRFSDATATYSPATLSINQQLLFMFSGTLSAGTLPTRIYAHDVGTEATISEIFVCFNTPPLTNDVRVNILKNGATIFSPPAYVAVIPAANTGSKTTGFLSDTFVKDDYFQVNIAQADSTAANLTVHIRYNYDI